MSGGGKEVGRIVRWRHGSGRDQAVSFDGYLNESGDDKERVRALSMIFVHNGLQPFDVFINWVCHGQPMAESGVVSAAYEGTGKR